MRSIYTFIIFSMLGLGCDPTPQEEGSVPLTMEEFMSQPDFATAAELMAEHENILSVRGGTVSVVMEPDLSVAPRKLADEHCIKVYCGDVYAGSICGATSMEKVIAAALAMCP